MSFFVVNSGIGTTAFVITTRPRESTSPLPSPLFPRRRRPSSENSKFDDIEFVIIDDVEFVIIDDYDDVDPGIFHARLALNAIRNIVPP